jgi:signal transduction histidine kinase
VINASRWWVSPTWASRPGVPRPVFGVVLDVTDRERRRQLESRTERLVTTGLLAAGVGHEINNPLAFILNNLEYARDELRAQAAPAPAELLGRPGRGARRRGPDPPHRLRAAGPG